MNANVSIRHIAIITLIAVLLTAAGCSDSGSIDPGEVQTSKQSVELGQATAVKAVVNARTEANVIIRDGAASLLTGQFTYNELLKPDVSYSVDGTLGSLEVSQPARQNLTATSSTTFGICNWDQAFPLISQPTCRSATRRSTSPQCDSPR
jgi:hypothetical protein